MKKTVLYLFITSLVLVLFGWFTDSDKVKPSILVQMIEFIAMTIIVFSVLSGFTWIIMKVLKRNSTNGFNRCFLSK